MSAYAHNRALLVKRGDKVRRGQAVGRAGQSGGLAEPQLHFELRKGSKAVDPLKYLAPQSAGVAPGPAVKWASSCRCQSLMPHYWRTTG